MRALHVTLVLLTALVLSETASADVFDLRNNPVLCSGSCGTVTVMFSAGTIYFAINAAPNVLFGTDRTFGFNVVGITTGVTFSNFSSGYSLGTAGNITGLGSYDFRISGPTANSGQTSFSFDIARPGDVFTGVSDVYEASIGGNSAPGGGYFAAQLHDPASGNPGISAFVQTGLTPVPEPASLLLLSTAVGGVWLLRRRRPKA